MGIPWREKALVVPSSSGDTEGGDLVSGLCKGGHSYLQHSIPLPKTLAKGRHVGKEPLSSCMPKEAQAELTKWEQAVEHLLLPVWRGTPPDYWVGNAAVVEMHAEG